jgi:hypothetical protein
VSRTCVALLIAVITIPSHAEGLKPPTGADWQDHCGAYLRALDGDAEADNFDVTYCVGMTLGIVAGMRMGSQLGALSMASSLAVDYELDTAEVFAKFDQKSPEALLQICPPATPSVQDYIRAVDAYLRTNPAKRSEPLAQVLFEALQATWTCQ